MWLGNITSFRLAHIKKAPLPIAFGILLSFLPRLVNSSKLIDFNNRHVLNANVSILLTVVGNLTFSKLKHVEKHFWGTTVILVNSKFIVFKLIALKNVPVPKDSIVVGRLTVCKLYCEQ